MSLQPVYVAGSNVGLETDKKPFLLTEQAFQILENAYVWRERVKKREGLNLLGRLRRLLTGQALGNTIGDGTFNGNIISILGLESTSEIEMGSITVTVGAQTFKEPATPNGTLTNGGTINYVTGDLTIATSPILAGTPVTITFNYFPGLPVMGIFTHEIANINDEETFFFDTKYAYKFVGTGFQEVVSSPVTTWDGTDADFFWCTNYQGSSAAVRLLFVTNNFNSATIPMRYYNGAWNDFTPQLDNKMPNPNLLLQARILIPYYGRLLALNTQEGTAKGGGSNYFSRCRFSQLGDPTAADAWRSDIFGKGGFIDAPTNEAIVSASFIKNTLIVFFERSTWQLRYLGEYGLPFIWERISADLGCESTNSPIIFNEGALAVGDKAIITADAVGVQRIDLKIPDFVFNIRNADSGMERVVGIRDYPKELVYWCCSNSQFQRKFPNQVLVYNYRNNTWAIFRDNVTFFGTFQSETGITWGRFDIFWNSGEKWSDANAQSQYPFIVSGNQQGFVHYYMNRIQDDVSLAITAINIGVTPVRLTIPNHNLEDGETIYLSGITYQTSTDLNNQIYSVTRIDDNTISLQKWNGLNYADVSSSSVGNYIGGGKVTLFPILYVQTKDFNPYEQQGLQLKLSYIDFQTDATPSAKMTVQLFINSSQANLQANLIVGNQNVETSLPSPYYPQVSSQYAWHRFYATCAGQYINFVITYDDTLKNDITTFQQDWQLNAFTLWTRPGGKNIF